MSFAVLVWSEETFSIIRCTIPGVGQKDSHIGPERKSLTQKYLQTQYPKESWSHAYTDGCAQNAVRNGGTGDRQDKMSLATGLCSTNSKAEAAAYIEVYTHASRSVVRLADDLFILKVLQSSRDTDYDLPAAHASLCGNHAVMLQ